MNDLSCKGVAGPNRQCLECNSRFARLSGRGWAAFYERELYELYTSYSVIQGYGSLEACVDSSPVSLWKPQSPPFTPCTRLQGASSHLGIWEVPLRLNLWYALGKDVINELVIIFRLDAYL